MGLFGVNVACDPSAARVGEQSAEQDLSYNPSRRMTQSASIRIQCFVRPKRTSRNVRERLDPKFGVSKFRKTRTSDLKPSPVSPVPLVVSGSPTTNKMVGLFGHPAGSSVIGRSRVETETSRGTIAAGLRGLARMIHEGSSRKRADATRDGHSETWSPEAYSCSMSKG